MAGIRWVSGGLVGSLAVLAACTVDPLSSAGRPCSSTNPCGPDAVCDLARGVCIAASLDRGPASREGPIARDVVAESNAPRESGAIDGRRSEAAPPPDQRSPDHPLPGDAGCPGGLALCGALCVDLATSSAHCGKCNIPCVAPTADRCVGAKCVCGTTGAACPSASTCAAGACDTNPCLGKGDGTLCDDKLFCTISDACKSGICVGAARDCSSLSTTCAEGTCYETAGQCGAKPRVSGTPCGSSYNGGKCLAGSCCTGCFSGSACMSGSSTSNCGDNGGSCKTCPATSLVCKKATCTDGSCGIGNATSGTSCTGGTCRSGSCCTGCGSSSLGSCRAGTENAYCGSAGGVCTDCAAQTLVCTGGVCG